MRIARLAAPGGGASGRGADPLALEFVDLLGLEVEWRSGLLEGIAHDGTQRWIISPHPQGKPRALWDEVAAAL